MLSRELWVIPRTVAKWRKRATVEDMETGPTAPPSMILSEAEKVMVLGFRRHTLLPLHDGLYALLPSIPHSTASASLWSPTWSKGRRETDWEFLELLIKALPYGVHTILTDKGIHFAEQPRNSNTTWARQMRFDMICEENNIKHWLTWSNHPWTNGQVERMNRIIKDATAKRFH